MIFAVENYGHYRFHWALNENAVDIVGDLNTQFKEVGVCIFDDDDIDRFEPNGYFL